MSPDGRTLVITTHSNKLLIFDLTDPATPKLSRSLDIEELPWNPVFTPDGKAPLEKVPYIPGTVVLDNEGTVLKVWFGMLTPDQAEELKRELAPTVSSLQ